MFVEHSANSDSTNTGKAYLKFVQDSDKSGSYFELNSECPQILGTFNLNTKNHVRIFEKKYTLQNGLIFQFVFSLLMTN